MKKDARWIKTGFNIPTMVLTMVPTDDDLTNLLPYIKSTHTVIE
jgi:hypothetical protein